MMENIKNEKMQSFIKKAAELCKPDKIHFCDGSKEEFQKICDVLEKEDRVIRLNPKKRPNSFYFRSHPDDVARVEEATFICTEKKEDAGPNNNWKDPKEMISHLNNLFEGCMKGRTMYVIPFCMGPLNSNMSLFGVQITDSEYVVCNMKIMSRMGEKALLAMGNKEFIPCLHSVGVPKNGEEKEFWPCNPEKRCIAHFPETRSIYSYGSGYGGNALLGKKCLGLRIASFTARKQGWLAEHMLILKLISPENEVKYIAAAFPSACGKTNLAMMQPSLKGWRIECIGDDIAWMRFAEDGKLYAINPEAGFFGVAPGTSNKTNPHAIKTLEKDVLFTNVALTEDKDVWWEGMSERPLNITSWLGNKEEKVASHPNARFTAPLKNCPILAKEWDHPEGVPISAIIFGGRRSDIVPLVFEAFDWDHGVFLGASISSEKTAAAKGKTGVLRQDPFAMLPFCGYNIADYFQYWFSLKEKNKNLPKIFHVNWFKKDKDGAFIWPGFGENIHILKWIFHRIDGNVDGIKTSVGIIPEKKDLSNISEDAYNKLFEIDRKDYHKELVRLEEYFKTFEDRLPKKIKEQIEDLKVRLS